MGEITALQPHVVLAAALAAGVSAAAAVWTVALIVVDASDRRLPNALTLPAAAIAVAACCVDHRGWVGLMWPGLYLFAGRGFGGGDVKLAVPLGVVLALVGGVGALLAGMLLASCFTVLYLLVRRAKSAPHGPSMLASAWIVGFASTFLAAV